MLNKEKIVTVIGTLTLVGVFTLAFTVFNGRALANEVENEVPEVSEVMFCLDQYAETCEAELAAMDAEWLEIYHSWERIPQSFNGMNYTLIDWSYAFPIGEGRLTIEEAGQIFARIAYEEYGVNLEGAGFEMSHFDYVNYDIEAYIDFLPEDEVDYRRENWLGRVQWHVDILSDSGQLNLVIDGVTGELVFSYQY